MFSNGDVFTGTWKAGKRHGQGLHTYCSGRKEVRVYRNGLRLSDAQVDAERKAKRAGLDPATASAMFSGGGAPQDGESAIREKIVLHGTSILPCINTRFFGVVLYFIDR